HRVELAARHHPRRRKTKGQLEKIGVLHPLRLNAIPPERPLTRPQIPTYPLLSARSLITQHHSQLVEHLTPFSDALHMPNAGIMSETGLPNLEMLEQMVTQQAAAMAYSNDFLLMTQVSLCAFPLLVLIRSPQGRAGPPLGEQRRHVRIVRRQVDRRP